MHLCALACASALIAPACSNSRVEELEEQVAELESTVSELQEALTDANAQIEQAASDIEEAQSAAMFMDDDGCEALSYTVASMIVPDTVAEP